MAEDSPTPHYWTMQNSMDAAASRAVRQRGYYPVITGARKVSAKRLNQLLDKPACRCAGLMILACVYTLAYLGHPNLPGNSKTAPLGWWGWWDQGQYLHCAATLAHGSLTPESYWYPIGYPLLGALFYRIAPQHAFFLPNAIAIIGSTAVFYLLSRYFISAIEAYALIAVFVVAYCGMSAQAIVEPWNTIPTQFLAYLIILLLLVRRPTTVRLLAASVCVALIYLCRPIDAVCMSVLLGASLLEVRPWQQRLRVAAMVAVPPVCAILAVLLLNRAIFHGWVSRYDVISARNGFGSYSFLKKGFLLLIDGWPLFRERDTGLVQHCPWLLLSGPGALQVVRRYGLRSLGLLGSIIATYAAYILYNDFWPLSIFRFHAIHYLFWTLPLLALFTYVGVRHVCTTRRLDWSCASIGFAAVLVGFVSLAERKLGETNVPDSGLAVPAGAEWLLVSGSTREPEFRYANREPLIPIHDYEVIARNDGFAVLLSKRAQSERVQCEVTKGSSRPLLTFGTLAWRWRWRGSGYVRTLLNPWMPITVTVLAKRPEIDETGPAGVPDGRPDQCIQVDGGAELLATIKDWDIETLDGRGRWVSYVNQRGWWRITTRPLQRGPAAAKARVVLVFPDFGDFERAAAFRITAVDKTGSLAFERVVKK